VTCVLDLNLDLGRGLGFSLGPTLSWKPQLHFCFCLSTIHRVASGFVLSLFYIPLCFIFSYCVCAFMIRLLSFVFG
jgi:hypothetical protein